MRVFVYEHVTGGGLLAGPSPRESSLFPEAASMTAALIHDLHRLPGADGIVLLDDRIQSDLPSESRLSVRRVATVADYERQFDAAVHESDFVLLIAPETDGALTRMARRVESLGGRLLSPSSAFCEWASDKSRVAETLQAAGAPAPRGSRLRYDEPWPSDFPSPAVLKPNDGCGSQDMRIIRDPSDDHRSAGHEFWRLEEFVPGQATSIAVIRGPACDLVLAPCFQTLADDGSFRYLGGTAPMLEDTYDRMLAVFNRCYGPIPDFHGYIGLDMVLGTAPDGSQDCLIEVNPRITTSYHAQRALVRANLIAVMIDLCEGRQADLDIRSGSVRFWPDGRISSVLSE